MDVSSSVLDLISYSNGDVPSDSADQVKSQQKLKSIMETLVHTSSCGDMNCKLVACKKMKSLVEHAKKCKLQANGDCSHCKNLFKLCCYHAKYCHDIECPVIHCPGIKMRIQQRRASSMVDPMIGPNEEKILIPAQTKRQLMIEQNIPTLMHAMKCLGSNCPIPSCGKKKNFLEHSKTCQLKTQGGCSMCKQLVELLGYHSKNCQNDKCAVLFCSNLKPKIRQIHERNPQNDTTTISIAGGVTTEISADIRSKIVSMLALAMDSTIDLNAVENEKTCELIKNARQTENCIYEQANSLTMYYKMSVHKIKSFPKPKMEQISLE